MMITEDELKRIEHVMEVRRPVEFDDIDELIAEIRRLNAAYEKVRKAFSDAYVNDEEHNAFWYEGTFMLAFVPDWLKDELAK